MVFALVFALFTGGCRGPRIRDDSTVSRADADGRHVLCLDRNRRGQHRCRAALAGQPSGLSMVRTLGKSATTDGSGNYSLTGLQLSGFTVSVSASQLRAAV